MYPSMIPKKCLLCQLLASLITMGLSLNAIAEMTNTHSLRVFTKTPNYPVAVIHSPSGYVTHLRLPHAVASTLSTEQRDTRARDFLASYRDEFLDATTPLDIEVIHISPVGRNGANHVRFQQSFKGIPVRGGEAIVHLSEEGVTSVESKLISNLGGIEMTPQISSSDAITAARSVFNHRYKNRIIDFTVPQLEIINVEQMHGNNAGVARLAWLIEATGDLDELIWVDAITGDMLAQVSRIAHVMDRNVTDAQNACYANISPTAPNYTEGNAPDNLANPDAVSAWKNAQFAYDYFNALSGRDGFDGSGRVSLTVNICDADVAHIAPSTENADWNPSSNQMLFGAGMTTDDIVAHEYTHAVIDNIDNGKGRLLLTGQSGALAEAFADIFGEVVDLTQAGNDAGNMRWDIGEATGKTFRNLMDPNAHNSPGKVTDPKFYCGGDNDVAIHVNSGVLSHAFALLVDGGSYNGVTATGIGIDKAARVFYKALTERLVSTSSFIDAYHALLGAADDLILANAFSANDRASLSKILSAVELDISPCSSKLAYCPIGVNPAFLFSDNFENPASGNWINKVITGVNHWISNDGTSGIYRPAAVADMGATFIGSAKALSGNYALWADNTRTAGFPNLRTGDSIVSMANAISLPTSGQVLLQFEHMFDFEALNDPSIGEPDGGVIEYSTDGGAIWTDSKTLISGGRGYGNFIQLDQFNPLAGRWAFVGTTSLVYVSTQLDLTSLAGLSVQFRFRMGTDKFSDRLGWLIDDVVIYTCGQQPIVADIPPGRKRKGGAADLLSILIMFAFIGSVRWRFKAIRKKSS